MDIQTCEYCETLNLSDLLTGHQEDEKNGKSCLHTMKRYYCNYSECGYDYCPFCGKKEVCPYRRG